MAGIVSSVLSKRLNTEVKIGRIQVGILGKILIQDLEVMDREHKPMLHSEHTSVMMDIKKLIKDKSVHISNAQLFGADIHLRQMHPDSALNVKFVLDAFASKDTTRTTPLDVAIKRLLIRNTQFTFDREWCKSNEGTIDPNHISVKDLNLQLTLHNLENNHVKASLPLISLHEENSGITLHNMKMNIEADKNNLWLNDFLIEIENSRVNIPTLQMHFPYLPFEPGTRMREWGEMTNTTLMMEAKVSPADLSKIWQPLAQLPSPITLGINAKGTLNDIQAKQVNLSTEDGFLVTQLENLHLRGIASGTPIIETDIRKLHISHNALNVANKFTHNRIPLQNRIIQRLLDVNAAGHILASKERIITDISLFTQQGSMDIDGQYIFRDKLVDAHVTTPLFHVAPLVAEVSANSPVGDISCDLQLTGHVIPQHGLLPQMAVKGNIPLLQLNGYNYHNIKLACKADGYNVKGDIGLNDTNVQVDVNGDVDFTPKQLAVDADVNLRHLNIDGLGLLNKPHKRTYAGRAKVQLKGNDLKNPYATLDVNYITMTDSKGPYTLHNLYLQSRPQNGERHLTLESPYVNAHLDGTFEPKSLAMSARKMLHVYVPMFFENPEGSSEHDNVSFDVEVLDATPLDRWINYHIDINQYARVEGRMDAANSKLELKALTPSFEYKNLKFDDISVFLESEGDSMNTVVNVIPNIKNFNTDVTLMMQSAGDRLQANLKWDEAKRTNYGGELNFDGIIGKDEEGKPTIKANLKRSTIYINNEPWMVHPSTIAYHNKGADIDSLVVSWGDRFLKVHGRAAKDPAEKIYAEFRKIDLGFILRELVNLKPVSFDGIANGVAVASNLFDKPQADATVWIPDFRFNNGHMGDAEVHMNWGKVPDNIVMDAVMEDEDLDTRTHAKGQLCPIKGKGSIDMNIEAHRTNIHFINRYTENIFSKIEGMASGNVHIYGPFKQIDLEGAMLVDEAEIGIPYIGVDYHLNGDSVWVKPGIFSFRNARIYDPQGNSNTNGHYAIASGELQHNHFSNMRYDVRLDGHNILGYDFKDFGDLPFYGHVLADGKVRIKGEPGRIDIDVNAIPKRGSQLVYNATSPETLTEQNFLKFKSKGDNSGLKSTTNNSEAPAASTTDMNIHFDLDINDDATMRILMDGRSGDWITVRGNGRIRAEYNDKNPFQMFGTYTLEEGNYELHIQGIARKDFTIQNGGKVAFRGDAMDADLDVKAIYTVPSVSLNDLSSKGTFASNNVRVNCLMSITGKIQEPHINFDFDIPNVNEDEKQMVRALISTDEERTMQVVYLLGIGRFYTYDYTGTQTQSYTAVNSFLSSTLSSQLNSMLNNMIGNNNWNIGANLTTGEMGWNDVDFETNLSGRLWDNRLLINGNFGYRDNPVNNSNFIGDFDAQVLVTKNGNIRLKAYSETNDRYFTKSSLTTQGIGIIAKKDFTNWRSLFISPKRKERRAARKAARKAKKSQLENSTPTNGTK